MNKSTIPAIGNVATEIRFNTTPEGIPVASFRLAATERKFDRETSRWVDGEVNWYTVSCWRALAENVANSVQKGDPVFVIGRLSGTSVDITADIVGHDLARGTTSFKRSAKQSAQEFSTVAA